MAPYLMAFGKPKHPGAPVPPWKAARGGLGFDIEIEISLAQEVRPIRFDRLNTLWWVFALLRLATGAPLRMPVISDMAFSAIANSDQEPNLWTIEMLPHQFLAARSPPTRIEVEHLNWLRKVFASGAELMKIEAFNRAFQTFDSAIWAHSPASAAVMLWSAIETLFRPGRTQVTKTLPRP